MENIPDKPHKFDSPRERYDEVSIMEYLRIAFDYKWLILSIFAGVMLLTVLYTICTPQIYEASSVVLLEDRNITHDFMMFTHGGSSRNSINNTTEILQSRPVLNLAFQYIQRFTEHELFPIMTAESSDPVFFIREKMSVTTKRDTDIIIISFQSTDPTESMVVANAIADALIYQNTQLARLEFTNAREFLESQLEVVTKRLESSEENLRDYKVETGVFQLSAETDHLIERSAIANADLLSARAEYTIAKNNLDFLQNELAVQDSLLLNVTLSVSTPFIEQLKSEVVRTMGRITTLMNNNEYAPDHPEIVRLQRALDNATNRLDEEIRKTLAIRAGSIDVLGFRNDLIQNISTAQIEENLAQARVESYQTIVNSFEHRLGLLPDTELELARLQRNNRIDEQIFSILAENLEDARVAEQARMGNLRIIDRAIVPNIPVKPNKRVNIMVGTMLGLLLGISISLFLYTSNTKIRTLDDVERYVKSQIVGTIPFMSANGVNAHQVVAKGERGISIRLITHYAPKSPVAEAYRTLRTNVIAKKTSGSLSLIVTSSGPHEGKSTSITNLAIAIAQMNSRVILVDFDLRRPMIHNIFELDRNNGTSDFLSEPSLAVDTIIKSSNISNLDIITCGAIPPNPSELIASNRTDEMIAALKARYEYVLIDMPPVIAVTDAMIMAKKTDLMFMVIMANNTDRVIIQRTQTMLQNINVNIAGVIVNGINYEKYYRGYDEHYYYLQY